MFVERPVNAISLSKRKLVCGVGINDSDYMTWHKVDGVVYRCPYYKRWHSMIKRCYSKDLHDRAPTYKDCSVCDEWLSFMSFRGWMEKQDWKGKHLDKDLLVQGNRVYSPWSCVFVSCEVNNCITINKKNKGEYPAGVRKHTYCDKYQAECRTGQKVIYIGLFDTVTEAAAAYKEFKYNRIAELASKQKEPVRTALLRWEL